MAVSIAILPLSATIAWASKSRRWQVGTACIALVGLCLAIAVLFAAPTGRAVRSGGVRSEFNAGAGFSRFALSNLLPEGDQLLFGFTLMPMVDPLLTTNQASELKDMTRNLYREIERNSEFRALGSAMQATYDDLLGRTGEANHVFVYVPAGIKRAEPRPILVFFHGSGGNFKAYTWILSKLADQLGFVLAAPSGGMGNWTMEQSVACLDLALTCAERSAKIDRGNIHILGLSNGGKAVSQLGRLQGSHFQSLVFISPVFDDECISSTSFADQCRNRPVLVISGGRDDRVPISYVKENVRTMALGGVSAELQTINDADHFLIFSHREQMIQFLTVRFREQGATK